MSVSINPSPKRRASSNGMPDAAPSLSADWRPPTASLITAAWGEWFENVQTAVFQRAGRSASLTLMRVLRAATRSPWVYKVEVLREHRLMTREGATASEEQAKAASVRAALILLA
jgi:hypothetical protein